MTAESILSIYRGCLPKMCKEKVNSHSCRLGVSCPSFKLITATVERM